MKTLLAVAMLAVPALAYAQAECTKNDFQWSQFLATDYHAVQVRCRCMDGGTYYGKWSYQFKNAGNERVAFNYAFVYGRDQYPGTNVTLSGHSVTPISISSFGSCNYGLSLFVNVSDSVPGANENRRKKGQEKHKSS